MSRISKIIATKPQPAKETDGLECYYNAPATAAVKPAPNLSALELMYAYYDAA